MQLHIAAIPVFICLVASTYCQPTHYYGPDGRWVIQLGTTDQNKDGSSDSIVKRALSPLAIVGKEAVEYLLKGAKYKRVDGDGYKLFEKRGRFKDARRDFNAVKPTNKKMKKKNQSDNTVITGTVGDRRIQLRYNKISFGHKEFPIVLINSPGEQPIKIIYKN